MIKEIRDLVKRVLKDLDCYSIDAVNLVMRTGMAETGFRHLKQINGRAIGFFQVEPLTAFDLWENFAQSRPKYRDVLLRYGFDDGDLRFIVTSNIAIQIALCRLHYRRFKEPIPTTLEGQAKYWKAFYNTKRGKGTVEHFIEANGGEK
jgi:hypothetical protein